MKIEFIVNKYESEIDDLKSIAEKYPKSWQDMANEYKFYNDNLSKCYDKLLFDIKSGRACAYCGEFFGKFIVTDANEPIIIFWYDDNKNNLIHIQNYRAYNGWHVGRLPEFVTNKIDEWLINFIKNEKCSWKLKHKDMQLFNLLKRETE